MTLDEVTALTKGWTARVRGFLINQLMHLPQDDRRYAAMFLSAAMKEIGSDLDRTLDEVDEEVDDE